MFSQIDGKTEMGHCICERACHGSIGHVDPGADDHGQGLLAVYPPWYDHWLRGNADCATVYNVSGRLLLSGEVKFHIYHPAR
jgi:hypothetical protein